MGKVLLEEQNLIDIANSIRNKKKSTDTMKPSEMATNIDGIESGGADLSEYFTETFEAGSSNNGWSRMIKKIPACRVISKNASYSFYRFIGTEIDLSIFDTTGVTNMSYMFYLCSNLTSLDLSNFNTSSVTTMSSMFQQSSALTSLDLSGFNTDNVISMQKMFYSCGKLISLNMNNWNTNKVTNMSDMFNGCSALTSLDLSSFDTSSVTNMSGMFKFCRLLKYLDIRNFDFTNVATYTDIFGVTDTNGVPSDCLIIVKDETAKEWVLTQRNDFTNVKTVAEYESGV